jgi:hypothetical protein
LEDRAQRFGHAARFLSIEGLLGLRHAVEEEVIDLLVLVVHRRGDCLGICARRAPAREGRSERV